MPLIRRLCWCAILVLCVSFAPMAAEFYFLLHFDTPPTYARLLAVVVDENYAFSTGSGMAEVGEYWKTMPAFNQKVLGVHAILASICLVLGPFLLSSSFRESNPVRHRKMGKVYYTFGVLAMLLSFLYLSITPFQWTYGGG